MEIKVFNSKDIAETISMREAIEVMGRAFSSLDNGHVLMPLRTAINMPKNDAVTFVMPAYMSDLEQLGLKVVSVFPNNQKLGIPTIHGVVILLNSNTGEIAAILDGTSITSLRTGAVSGLATDLLARENSKILAVIGSGAQAKTQVDAVLAVRDIKEILIYSRTSSNANKFAEELQAKYKNIAIKIMNSVREASILADIICTATPVSKPILNLADIKPGTHINAVGAHSPEMQELSLDLMDKATVVVDQKLASLAESGEIINSIASGILHENYLIELGQIVNNKKDGRSSEEDITIFKSVGLAIQDITVAHQILIAALMQNKGKTIKL